MRSAAGQCTLAHLASARRVAQQFAYHLSEPVGGELRLGKEDGSAGLGQDTVTAVAYRWGFSSASRFSAYYRNTYGVSPRQTLEHT